MSAPDTRLRQVHRSSLEEIKATLRGEGKYKMTMSQYINGRGLHSSSSQLGLSRFWSLKPQQASTSQLNQRRFCRYDLRA